MHEYVRKSLVAALLIVSAAILPSLPTVAGFPDRSSVLARAAACPLFGQIWDKLPSREIEIWIPTHSDDCRESEWLPASTMTVWTPKFRNVHTCLLFQAYLRPAFEGSLSAVGEYDGVVVSIRMCVIGCTLGRKSLFVSAHSARYGFYQDESHILGGFNATRVFQDYVEF